MDIEQVREALKNYFGSEPILYTKITAEEEWANQILEGKLYMKNIDFYRKLEEEMKSKGQGDKGEVVLAMNLTSLRLSNPESNKEINAPASRFNFTYNGDEKTPIFCLGGLKIDDFDVINYGDDFVTLAFKYTEDELDKLKNEFGEYMVLINAKAFKENIEISTYQNNCEYLFEPVIYSEENLDIRIQSFAKCEPKRFLFKDLCFKHQKEYRLVLPYKVDDNMTFQVRALKEIAGVVKIDDLKDLALDMKCEFYRI